MAACGMQAMMSALRAAGPGYNRRVLSAVQAVTADDVIRVLRKYLVQVNHPAKGLCSGPSQHPQCLVPMSRSLEVSLGISFQVFEPAKATLAITTNANKLHEVILGFSETGWKVSQIQSIESHVAED